MNTAVLCCSFRGVVDEVLQFLWKTIEITKEANPHLFFFQRPQFFLQDPLEQGHQKIHLIPWTGPIFR